MKKEERRWTRFLSRLDRVHKNLSRRSSTTDLQPLREDVRKKNRERERERERGHLRPVPVTNFGRGFSCSPECEVRSFLCRVQVRNVAMLWLTILMDRSFVRCPFGYFSWSILWRIRWVGSAEGSGIFMCETREKYSTKCLIIIDN